LALGRVESFFSLAQGFGSLIMGFVLDRFGVKTGLVVNFVACAAQYYLLSISTSMNILFLSKVPGMMMGGFLCAQTAIAKVTDDGPSRIAALGRLTSAYTVGGLVGPALGGVLGSSGNYYLGAQLATAGSLLAVGLVFLLPNLESSVPKAKKVAEKVDKSQSWPAQAAMVLQLAGPLLATKVITGIGNNMARSVQSIILKNQLSFDEAMMGSMMSGQFAFGGFANAFLLAPLAALLGGQMEKVVSNCVIVMCIIYVAEAALFLPAVASGFSVGVTGCIYVGISLFLSVFQYSLATSITAKTQALVPRHMTGTLMGIEHSIFSLTGMLGPLLGTSVFQSQGLSGLAVACGALFFVAFGILQLALRSIASKEAKMSQE